MNPLLLGPLLELGRSLIERLIPDKEAARRAEVEWLKAVTEGDLKQVAAQLEINAKEAAHPSVFVAGWRPAVGWVCVAAMGFQYLARPLLIGFDLAPGTMPGLDDNLWAVLLGLLGMGGLRTAEKVKGVAK